jgi:hypothetical protein
MCALFGGARDVSLFRKLNEELLHRYIDIEVLFYKLNTNATQTNIYDEADSKVYDSDTLLYSLVTLDDQSWSSEDFGSDVNQTATFAFLRDDLVDKNLVVSVGDIIEFKSRFFEIDAIVENQAVAGKDPDSWFGGDSHGYNVSIICQSHMTRQSKLNVIKTRFGNSINTSNSTLPKNL